MVASAIADVAAAVGNTALSIGKESGEWHYQWRQFRRWRTTSKLKEICEGRARRGAKSALGIASPSKAFADQVGLPITQGIIAGFVAGMPKVNGNLLKGVGLLMVGCCTLPCRRHRNEQSAASPARAAPALTALSQYRRLRLSLRQRPTCWAAACLAPPIVSAKQPARSLAWFGSAVELINTLQDFVQPTRAAAGRSATRSRLSSAA